MCVPLKIKSYAYRPYELGIDLWINSGNTVNIPMLTVHKQLGNLTMKKAAR